MKAASIWILGFLAFLAGLNAINAIVLWAQPSRGPESIIEPYLISSLIDGLSVSTYLWISILATFVFLGMTLVIIISKVPDPALLNNVAERVNDLRNDQDVFEKVKTRLLMIDAGLSDIREGFIEQRENTRKIPGELRKMEKATQNAIRKAEGINKKSEVTVRKQMKEIASIRMKMENLEKELTHPKPQLNSESELKKVKGIGTHLTNELKRMGVTSVGELVLTSPQIIAEKTGTTLRTVEKLQGRAQLLMVPGVKEKDIILLEELGVTNRRKLANQDSIELGMKMNGILKVYVENGKISEAEKPTIEEIDSWIRFARS